MRIRVRTTDVDGDGIEIEDVEDLTRLELVCDAGPEELRTVLARSRLGSLEGDTQTLIDAGRLRERAAAGSTSADWGQRWQGMLQHAERIGWTTPDRRSLLVHVARIDP